MVYHVLAMSTHKVEGAEELRALRIKHAKTIERSARILVEMESANADDREAAQKRAEALAKLLPDPETTTH